MWGGRGEEKDAALSTERFKLTGWIWIFKILSDDIYLCGLHMHIPNYTWSQFHHGRTPSKCQVATYIRDEIKGCLRKRPRDYHIREQEIIQRPQGCSTRIADTRSSLPHTNCMISTSQHFLVFTNMAWITVCLSKYVIKSLLNSSRNIRCEIRQIAPDSLFGH